MCASTWSPATAANATQGGALLVRVARANIIRVSCSLDPEKANFLFVRKIGIGAEDDDGGAGTVYAGLAQLFRLLRNAGGADRFNPLGPVETPGGNVAAVENTAPSPSRVTGTGGARAVGEQYRRQRSRPLVSREGQGPGCRAF